MPVAHLLGGLELGEHARTRVDKAETTLPQVKIEAVVVAGYTLKTSLSRRGFLFRGARGGIMLRAKKMVLSSPASSA
jgi:hypothetical protein